MIEYAILVDGEIIPCEWDSPEYRNWDRANKFIASDHVHEPLRKWFVFKRPRRLWVSTVFLTLNHGGYGGYPDQWFETMIFHRDYTDLYCDRYAMLEEAKAGHAKACDLARKGKIRKAYSYSD